MCITRNRVNASRIYNYDGGKIIHDCEIPSSRIVLGSIPETRYDIDIREFLTKERNSVIQNTLNHEVRSFLESMNSGHKSFRVGIFFNPAARDHLILKQMSSVRSLVRL